MRVAEILTIGDELLSPGKSDTNSEFLIRRLSAIGIPVRFRATIADDRARIADAVLGALKRSDWIFLTGGLGPTSDDLTRDAVAEALGLRLELHEPTLAKIKERFRAREREMPAVNVRQAMRLQDSEVLDNPVGTAPGLWVHPPQQNWSSKAVVLLPGPPRELHRLFDDSIEPRLRSEPHGDVTHTRSLNVVGLFESAIEARIGEIYRGVANPRTSVLASRGQVEIRLVAHATEPNAARRLADELASAMYERLGDHVFSEDNRELEEVVAHQLLRKQMTVSVAESLTGGLIMHRLTQVPGSSQFFHRGWVTYSDESKVELLGVANETLERVGAVSEEVAREMADGARLAASADFGLAVTGIAGPSGATDTKPVGLVYIGLSGADEQQIQRLLLPGDRAQIKQFTSQAALDLLRRKLLAV